MVQKLKYPGVPVLLDGKNYYVPSLSVRDFRANYEALTAPAPEGSTAKESFDRYIPIIGLAIRRNYPEVTNEFLEEQLDLHTFKLAIAAVQDASGMAPVTEGE